MAFKRTPHSGDMPAVLVIEPAKFERRCLVRLMRAAGAERVAEAIDLDSARRVLSLRRAAQWLLVADPDHLPGEAMNLLRLLTEEHAAMVLLLTQGRPPAADELRSQAHRHGLPLLAALRKPISAEEAGTLLQHLAQRPAGRYDTPTLSRDELNDCLRAGRVRARFQPKIDLDSGRPVACEAISYVTHARYGEISAAGYRHAAAQLGAQRVMTATVLREAAALVRSLRAKSFTTKVSVNLAVDVLSEAGDASALDSYVRTLGIAASDLVLEIDAARQAAGLAHLPENLARLKLCGYALALDGPAAAAEFGGAAHAHFSELKLSWTAMTRDANGASARHQVAAAISGARTLGMAICAMDVRTVADLHLARQAGIDLGQGELFADSMPAAEMLAWIEREERNRSFADRNSHQHQAS